MKRLDGAVAIVTGGATGRKAALGSLFAKALATEGARVVVADTKDCTPVVLDIVGSGGNAQAVTVDVSDAQSVQEMIRFVDASFGRLDILINNAAIGSNIPAISIEDMSVEAWDECMDVNVRGTFLCTKFSIPMMRRNNYGKIVNLSSTTILTGLPQRLHYVTSKGAIAVMTRAMARELGEYGIRVNSLAPGLVMNDSVAAVFADRPGLEDHILRTRSIKHHLSGSELLGTLLYLVTPDSDAVTGQYLVVDNGGDFT